MVQETLVQPKVRTRDRILDAAILRFARHAYETTALRDIAGDVGVDVAYVHRCFGSKEGLFREALRATIPLERLVLAASSGHAAADLARNVIARGAARTADEVEPLDIVIRSLSSPTAAPMLREFIVSDVIAPLAGNLAPPAVRRAALLTAFLAGFGILRDVLGIDTLSDVGAVEIEQLVTDAIGGILGAGSPGKNTS